MGGRAWLVVTCGGERAGMSRLGANPWGRCMQEAGGEGGLRQEAGVQHAGQVSAACLLTVVIVLIVLFVVPRPLGRHALQPPAGAAAGRVRRAGPQNEHEGPRSEPSA